MLYALAVLVVVLTLAILAMPYRASFLRERPFSHRGLEYPHATALARNLGEATTLEPTQAPPGFDWIGDFFLAPVWLFWGDLRSRRPINRLRRWRLGGARPSGRTVYVQLGPDRVRLEFVTVTPPLKAVAATPLEEQEELRALHPVGGARWIDGAAMLQHLFALGAVEVRGGATVTAAFPLSAVDPERLVDQLDALEAFAALIATS